MSSLIIEIFNISPKRTLKIDDLNFQKSEWIAMETTDTCYCLEMFRKKDPNVQGECVKMQCGRYKLEMRRKSENPMSLKEINRKRQVERA